MIHLFTNLPETVIKLIPIFCHFTHQILSLYEKRLNDVPFSAR